MNAVDRRDFPNAVWHITSRVNWQAWYLEPEEAAQTFLGLFREAADRYLMGLYSHVVMSNHFHFVAQSPDEEDYRRLTSRRCRNRHRRAWPPGHPKSNVVGQFMRELKLGVANRIQGKLGIQGHFWEGKHYRRGLHDEWAMVVAIAYDHRNPVREGMATRPEDYERSSARWWKDGGPCAVPLCGRPDFPHGSSLEAFRDRLLRFQQEKRLDDVMDLFRKSRLPIDSLRGRAYLERLLERAGLTP